MEDVTVFVFGVECRAHFIGPDWVFLLKKVDRSRKRGREDESFFQHFVVLYTEWFEIDVCFPERGLFKIYFRRPSGNAICAL